jgi:glutamine synthetase
MSATKVMKMMKDNDVKYVDMRFTDTIGKEQHVTIPASTVKANFFKDGKMFDGSSISGWKGINESDMVLMPDTSTAVLDLFSDETTMTSWNPRPCRAMSVTRVPSPNGRRPI